MQTREQRQYQLALKRAAFKGGKQCRTKRLRKKKWKALTAFYAAHLALLSQELKASRWFLWRGGVKEVA